MTVLRWRGSVRCWARRAMGAGALLVALLMLGGCRPATATQAASTAETMPARNVKAVRLQPEKWPRTVHVQGGLAADEISIVGTRVANRVKEVRVDLGSVVRRGDVLVVLETDDFELRVQEAQAQLEQVRSKLGLGPDEDERTLDRQKVPLVSEAEAVWNQMKSECARSEYLAKVHAIAMEEVQQRQAAAQVAEAKYRTALNDVSEQVALASVKRAELALARQYCTDAVIRAPFDGVVQSRHVAPGSYLQVGQAVATLVRSDPLRFYGGVPERAAASLRLKQPARITVAGQAKALSGTVTRIAPALDISSRALQVQIDLPNPDLRLQVGLFAEADVVVDPSARTLAVPATAVYQFAGAEKVWLVQEGKASERAVQTGRRDAERVEIRAGLARGDVILIDCREGVAGPVVPEILERAILSAGAPNEAQTSAED